MARAKHTHNGNIKLVMDAEQASVLLARLGTTYQERLEMPYAAVHILDHLEEAMLRADILPSYQVSLTR